MKYNTKTNLEKTRQTTTAKQARKNKRIRGFDHKTISRLQP